MRSRRGDVYGLTPAKYMFVEEGCGSIQLKRMQTAAITLIVQR